MIIVHPNCWLYQNKIRLSSSSYPIWLFKCFFYSIRIHYKHHLWTFFFGNQQLGLIWTEVLLKVFQSPAVQADPPIAHGGRGWNTFGFPTDCCSNFTRTWGTNDIRWFCGGGTVGGWSMLDLWDDEALILASVWLDGATRSPQEAHSKGTRAQRSLAFPGKAKKKKIEASNFKQPWCGF